MKTLVKKTTKKLNTKIVKSVTKKVNKIATPVAKPVLKAVAKPIAKKVTKSPKLAGNRVRILSRHPSHNVLRNHLPRLGVKSVFRLGSTTQVGPEHIEINSVQAVQISSSKRLMKERFNQANVKTAPWFLANTTQEITQRMQQMDIPYPIVAKSFYGSRGDGNTLIKNEAGLLNWAHGKQLSRYLFEKYMPYALEFRLHVTRHGCFYTCRKALRANTPEKDKWRRHIDTSVWLREDNPDFKRPNTWNLIVADCVSALNAIGADVLSFDVRVQSAVTKEGKRRKQQEWVLIECNSASSMASPNGDEVSVCAQRYIETIPNLILEKAGLLVQEPATAPVAVAATE